MLLSLADSTKNTFSKPAPSISEKLLPLERVFTRCILSMMLEITNSFLRQTTKSPSVSNKVPCTSKTSKVLEDLLSS
jgi:hypothetical protein